MSFEITGSIAKIYETETKGESFRVREFVIKADDGGQFDNFVKFQCTQDRTGMLDKYGEGDMVKVHFDLRGRQWQESYYTNLNAWRVEDAGSPASEPVAEKGDKAEPAGKMVDPKDLPF